MSDFGKLVWKATGLWYPGETTVAQYGTIRNPQGGEVVDPLNDTHSADVTVSMYDPIVKALIGRSFQIALKAYWQGELEFWGPIKNIQGDFAAGTLKLSALDPSIRLIHHQLRRGDLDGALSQSNQDQSAVTIDGQGMRLLRDAGLNTDAQTADGVPDLGIFDGENTFTADPDSAFGVQRGEPVWDRMLGLSEALGPDLNIRAVEDTVGAYARLDTFEQRGIDRTGTVQFHFGAGRKNLENMVFNEGAEYVTHAHMLDEEASLRFTQANTDARRATGPYVRWTRSGFKRTPSTTVTQAETVLRAQGETIIQAFSRPLLSVDLVLPVDDGRPHAYRYREHYATGDIVTAAAKKGYAVIPEEPHRITKVTLKQEENSPLVRPIVQVVSSRALLDSIDSNEN